jgi:hypothetical protein
MSLFTIVLDWQGGTYLAQVKASSPSSAIRKWVHGRAIRLVPTLGARGRASVLRDLDADGPTPVERLSGVWCGGFATRSGSGLINVVRTDG